MQIAPFMQKAVPAEGMDVLLEPLWLVLDGQSFSSYDLSKLKPELTNYLKKYLLEPIAGIGAMFCVVLLSLLVFLLW